MQNSDSSLITYLYSANIFMLKMLCLVHSQIIIGAICTVNPVHLLFAVIENKERLSTNYNANMADYQWSIELIDWHEKMGFITWRCTNYAIGLECNPNIVWNSEVFEHYKEKEF